MAITVTYTEDSSGNYYHYALSSFPTGKVAPSLLHLQIQALNPALSPAFKYISINSPYCDVYVVGELSGADLTRLNAVVASHAGVLYAANILAMSTVQPSIQPIISVSPLWDLIGGVSATASLFSPDLTGVIVRLVGSYKTDGTGASIQVLEDSSQHVMASMNFANTNSVWTPFGVNGVVAPSVGANDYLVNARTANGVSCSLRFVTVALVKLIAESLS